MINLLEAGTYIQAIFMSILFLETVINVCYIPNLFLREYRAAAKIVTFVFNIVGFSLLVILTTGINALLCKRDIPHISELFLENAEYSLVYILLNLVFIVSVAVGEYRYRKNSVSSLSIKESFDHLPTGLCFSKANGTVQLVNHKMNELGYILTGEEIQNANRFWKALVNGDVLPDVHRISDSKQPEYRLSDGTVYTFRREKVENVFQITATDTTSLHKLTNRLRMNNEELEEMNARLRHYGETVDETTRARERLETKIRIHSELGQALLATRHTLSLPDADFQPIISTWNRNIAVLRTEAEPSQSSGLLNTLIEIAESAGVTVEINGDFPINDAIGSILTSAATEALTNAVIHADAKTLFVEFYETDDSYCARYTNNGNQPTTEIHEGGGLGSLRSKIERLGGNMEIQSVPQFVMTVQMPKEVKLF
ncbi:MAG: hypothetical protein IIW48_11270 [Clostridia bacterium]|nr:hypothetical protein [Clostridia bacterium]